MKLFDWRGAMFPEELADETLNRVTRKIDEGEEIRNVASYCQGVARLVFLETLKQPESNRTSLDNLKLVAAVEEIEEEEDGRRECFEECLRNLPAENRELILRYYQEEKRTKINLRLSLAEGLGIPLSALRNRAQRIRGKLEQKSRTAANVANSFFICNTSQTG